MLVRELRDHVAERIVDLMHELDAEGRKARKKTELAEVEALEQRLAERRKQLELDDGDQEPKPKKKTKKKSTKK